MTNLFVNWYSLIRISHTMLVRLKIYAIHEFVVLNLANRVLPFYFSLTKNCVANQISRAHEPDVVVSLTSFPARIESVHLAIETILRQKVKVDRVILWLSSSQFKSESELPKKLLELKNRGLDIHIKDNDFRSHEKYCYALTQFPNAKIICVDDDIFYRSTLVGDLLRYHSLYPDAIIAHYAKRIIHKDGARVGYKDWPVVSQEDCDSDDLFFGSGGGTLFPPHSLYRDVTNSSLFMNLTPYADDIWLNAMARLSGRRVVKTDSDIVLLCVKIAENVTLSSVNNDQNRNDEQLKSIEHHYPELRF